MTARLWHAAMAGGGLAFLAALVLTAASAWAAPQRPLGGSDLPHLFLWSWAAFTALLALAGRSGLPIWRAALGWLAGLALVAAAVSLAQSRAPLNAVLTFAALVLAATAIAVRTALAPPKAKPLRASPGSSAPSRTCRSPRRAKVEPAGRRGVEQAVARPPPH